MINEEERKKIIFGGPIITMNDETPIVEAVGINGERIVAVGSLEHVKENLENSYQLINLNGSTLLAGFCDCHLHPIMYIFYLLSPNFSHITNVSQFKEFVKKITDGKSSDKLIIGFNLSEEKFDNPILPTRWDLDDACSDKPLFVLRYDSHIGIANSKALELAGINTSTIVPEGGEIRKNKNGELTGIISERALDLILSKLAYPNIEEMNEAFINASQILAKNGLTSLHGIFNTKPLQQSNTSSMSELSLFEYFKENFFQNCYIFIEVEDLTKFKYFKKSSLDENKKYPKFKIGGLKLFLDGTLGAKTACMYEPFTDAPETCGFCVIDENEIYEKMKFAHNKGLQIIIHSIGDKSCRIAIDLFIRLLTEYPKNNHRHRIEHASLLTNDVIMDMERYGIIASCQPPFINSEYQWLEKRLGKKRIKYTYPFKSIIDKGATLISGSDCPIEDPSPIQGLHALVNRNNFVPEQCVTVEEALKTYTINAAYASFQEDIKGSIEVGKLADFVMLDQNPLTIDKKKIKEIKILETIIRGKTVYKLKS